ncbi:MAG: HYR domain-containing protein [Acidobacteriota bacterium]
MKNNAPAPTLDDSPVNGKRDRRPALTKILSLLLLIAGAFYFVNDIHSDPLASATLPEAYSTSAQSSPVVGTAQLKSARRNHTATELRDGRILVIGGESKKGPVSRAEIFDPATSKFSPSASLITPRFSHTATLLTDGRVLVAGGRSRNSALTSTEIFDPAKGRFVEGPALHHARSGHTAVPLNDRLVLIFGGDAEGTAEVFDSTTDMFIAVNSSLSVRRTSFSAIALVQGDILIVGGVTEDGKPSRAVEIFNSRTLRFTETGRMKSARVNPALNVLFDGKVQVIGGDEQHTMEIFDPALSGFAGLAPLSAFSPLLSDLLRTPSRAAFIYGRNSSEATVSSSGMQMELLDRDQSSITEARQSGRALVTGGRNRKTAYLKSAVILDHSEAMLSTEKSSYEAGETVLILGSGWEPKEAVRVAFYSESKQGEIRYFTCVADKNGNLSALGPTLDSTLSDPNYLVAAAGQSSGLTAQTVFEVGTQVQACPTPGSGAAGVAGFAAGCTSCDAMTDTCNGQFKITLVSTSSSGSQVTFNYQVCKKGTGPSFQDLSHFVLDITGLQACLAQGKTLSDLVVACGGCEVQNGLDPTTQLGGVKYNGGSDTCLNFSLTLDESALAENQTIGEGCIVAATKAGNQDITRADRDSPGYACVRGPVCEESVPPSEAPTISCSPNINTNADPGQCSASVSFTVTATGTPTPTVECKIGATTITSPHTFPVGTTTVNCTATNTQGTANCSFTVTVADTQPPTIDCPNDITQSTDPDQCSAVVNYSDPSVGDNCSGVGSPMCTPPSGSTFPKGTTTVVCTVTDAANNSAMCSFTVTVNDTQPPSITCPQNISVPAPQGTTSATVSFTATANDNCDGTLTPVCTPPSGSSFPLGTTNVSCKATDSAGNMSTCSFQVDVTGEGPSFTSCQSNITVNNDPGQCSASASFTVTATGTPTPTVECKIGATTITSPHTFPVGTTMVNCTATNTQGTANCSFTVTVNDTEPPVVSCPTSFTVSDGPGDTKIVTFTATATDNCPGVSAICTPPSGSAFPVGTTTVNCTAMDAAGNMAASGCAFDVEILPPQQIPPTLCIQDSASGSTLIIDLQSGAFTFCCVNVINPITITGVGMITVKGEYVFFEAMGPSYCISAKINLLTNEGIATLRAPMAVLRCSIRDLNITDNTCECPE